MSMNLLNIRNIQAIVESPLEETVIYPRRDPPTQDDPTELRIQDVKDHNLESAQTTTVNVDRAIFFLKTTNSLK